MVFTSSSQKRKNKNDQFPRRKCILYDTTTHALRWERHYSIIYNMFDWNNNSEKKNK